MSESINVCSFFSGLGFLDLGFEKSGFSVRMANEYHKPFLDAYIFARDNLNHKSETQFFCKSVEELRKRKGSIDSDIIKNIVKSGETIFIGGPPCPDFSVGGKNRGQEGENGRLSQTYVDIICDYKPTAFLFENVKGLWRTKRHREFYESLKVQLESNGYVFTERLTNSLEFGAAQDRDRIILIGVQKKFLKKNGFEDLRHFDWEENMKHPGLRDLDAAKSKQIDFTKNPELTVQYWFDANKVETHPNASHCFVPRAALAKFQVIEEGDDSKKSFKRLHRYRYSPTAAYGNNEVHIHPTKARRISAAEALAIQSLPQDFELPQNMTLTNMFKGIGNGVPFVLSLGLAKSIKKQIFNIS